MGMHYTIVETRRELIHEELLAYLRENKAKLTLSSPHEMMGSERIWFEQTSNVGQPLNRLVDELYDRLINNGKAQTKSVDVHDSTIMHAYNAYIPLQVKTTILEEVFELIRIGVLIQAKFTPKHPGMNFDFEYDFLQGSIILTAYGLHFVSQETIIPYFADEFIDILRKTAEPDEELKGYISEGLACLRNRLGRASAILLRLAVEHTLTQLIDSTKNAIQSEQERRSFSDKIKKASTLIEQRAEFTFQKLESTNGLIPDKDYFRNMVSKRLRAAFHSIRDLGGVAAHLSVVIQLGEVRDHYTLFAGSVYPIAMQIIQYHDTIRS